MDLIGILIWATVITAAIFAVGLIFKALKRFLKIWIVVVLLLIAYSLMRQQGWIAW